MQTFELFSNENLISKLPRIAEGVLWVALAVVLLLALFSSPAIKPLDLETSTAPQTQARAKTDVEKLIALAPFGEAGSKSEPAGGSDDAPPSRRQIKLIGVMTGDKAAAFIAASDGGQRVIRPGEEIEPAVVLAEVGPQWIVIEADGQREKVSLSTFRGDQDKGGNTPRSETGGAAFAASKSGSDVIERAQLAQASDQMNGTSYYVAGEAVGFMLTAVAPDSALARMGLQPQDVIKTVNARPVVDAEQFAAVLADMGKAQELEVELLREGMPRKLRLKMPQGEEPHV